MNKVRVGICGLGTVGGGVFNVLQRNRKHIANRVGAELIVTHVGMRSDKPEYDLNEVSRHRDVMDVPRQDLDLIVETIGGTELAFDLVMEAISQGKQVVTANKALIAERGQEIFAAAQKQGVAVLFEAAVAGGIPIIASIRDGLAANQVQSIAGIINGTGNYILTQMRDQGANFADALAEAQRLGYAEADPTFDIEGIDAAHKLCILSALALGNTLSTDSVYTHGIKAVQIEDIRYAQELGYELKHLGVAKEDGNEVELRVHPALVAKSELMANVDGVTNAVQVLGDAVGTTFYSGPGAGAEPTASSVIADLVTLGRRLATGADCASLNNSKLVKTEGGPSIRSFADCETAHYLRFTAEDKPGVLSEVTRLLSEAHISVEALQQKEPNQAASRAHIALVTNKAKQSVISQVKQSIEAMDSIEGPVVHLCVENL